MTRERPILFSGPMVRALLDGRKTQTRRVVNPQPSHYTPGPNRHAPSHDGPYFDSYCSEAKTPTNPRGMSDLWCWWSPDDRQGPDWIRCPYGAEGDRLWVRETWAVMNKDRTTVVLRGHHQAPEDGWDIACRASEDHEHRGWRPSIHMPRWASRITLEVTEVRVQRLQEISEEDARAEGVEDRGVHGGVPHWKGSKLMWSTATAAFRDIWLDVNGDRAPWDANPWVWALTFKRVG